MWVLSWKSYKLSKFATFVSIIGALVRYAGVMCLFASAIPAALICIAIGIAIHFCAEAIAKKKAAKVSGNVQPQKPAPAPDKKKETVAQPTPPAPAQPAAAADGKIKCEKCGTLVAATTQFCSQCGNAMVPEKPKQTKCLRCGTEVEPGTKFCPECGYEIK